MYCFFVGSGGFEPPKSKTADLQSAPFGRSGNCPCNQIPFGNLAQRAEDGSRTCDLLITNQLLYQLSYFGISLNLSNLLMQLISFQPQHPVRSDLFV